MAVLLSSFITFLLVMDALGNVPLFLTSLKNTKPERRQWVILRECLIALGVMVAFLFLGRTMLSVLHIDDAALQAAASGVQRQFQPDLGRLSDEARVLRRREQRTVDAGR